MSPRVCVFGLWHLGSVTAAGLAEQGLDVIGLDLDSERIALLSAGRAPIAEPGLDRLIQAGLATGRLAFSSVAADACAHANVLWVTFDTPVDDDDQADVAWVAEQIERIRPSVVAGTLVLISSQVPVGFSRDLERRWRRDDPTLRFACVPENLRLGQAVQVFRNPDRVVVGLGFGTEREDVQQVIGTAADRIVWMSLESAEMTKHALNGFLAASVAYTNEVARLCELVGADAAEVEQGLRTEPRIGHRAYVTPGAPIGGGTLARDVAYLKHVAADYGVEAPVLSGILESNRLHTGWARARARELLDGVAHPSVAMLGLTYKAGTDTLRRSTAVELAHWLVEDGATVRAYDPALHSLPTELDWMPLASSAEDALAGTDLMILGTAWPEFRSINADQLVRAMRRPRVIDQTGFLPHLVADRRLQYVRVGHRSRSDVEST